MNVPTQSDIIPILMVDDRPENLLSLEGLLRDQEYELVRALSGNEALLLTLKQDFALVLLDVQMPGMDGFETAELMRANPKTRHIPIIFVTAGMKDLQFQFKGYDAGAVDYLSKPIEPLFLQSKVRIFAELYLQRQELEQHRKYLEELVALKTTELRRSNDQLQYRNRELKATEELLRGQITEFVETHDQLLATEEMLRVQIEEYEVGQKLLNESNRNLQALFDVSPLAIVASSFPDGVIREINRTFSDDFGYSEERVIGKTGFEIGLWVDNAERDRFFELMQEQQDVLGFDAVIRTFGGETRTVLVYCNHMDFKHEKCLLIVFLDVTEQKRMEEQIRQTQKMDLLGQLAGGVAHDFNNMLTAISGSAELLARHVSDNQNAVKLLGNILQATGRSAELTGQLLAFSRKGQKNAVSVCVHTTIQDVISLLERTIDKKIELKTDLNAIKTCVTGDPALLQNALLNLGVNARDAMPEGGILVFASANIELDSEFCESSGFGISAGPYIEISVSDTGVGMSKEIMQRIFEPFFTTKEIGKGTGLGLAAVYGTITDHQGCINISSELGHGTVFNIYLPLSDVKETECNSSEELIRGTGGVLLVDDEEILREVGQAILEELGYRVYLAEDGEQALEVFESEKENISLVILDMLMPKMGGKETLVQLKKKYPEIRVIISSGFHQEGTVAELVALGAKGFIQKPYLSQELCKTVAEAIGNSTLKRE
jgi:PAS domain S-box-containing protein